MLSFYFTIIGIGFLLHLGCVEQEKTQDRSIEINIDTDYQQPLDSIYLNDFV